MTSFPTTTIAIDLLKYAQIDLFDIEYYGNRSEDFYVGKPNIALEFIEDYIFPNLENNFGREIAELTIANSYAQYYIANRTVIDQVRLKYAVHFHNNCIDASHFNSADKWNEVIKHLS